MHGTTQRWPLGAVERISTRVFVPVGFIGRGIGESAAEKIPMQHDPTKGHRQCVVERTHPK
jgi:hypothetical protein